jgi:hypothetical protein
MQFKREKTGRTITVTDIPLRVDGITTAGDTMTVKVSYEGDSSARVGHTLDNAVIPLMAAAPELLDALRYMVENAEADGWSGLMLRDAKAAIAKAEGRD